MKGLRNLLLAEQKKLENIMKEVKARLEKAPEGSLRLSKSHNSVQYYCYKEGKRSGDYISKTNQSFARQLAQKSYDEKVLKVAEKRSAQIKRLLKDYTDDELEKIYLKEHPQRQKLVCPIVQPWEHKLKEWKTKDYKGKEFAEGAPVILTEKGERVRSKSEKIMADYFYRKGIEYKYECPLYLKGMGTVYPDFTFLSKKTGEEIYWEHNGKCDDLFYARDMVRKINTSKIEQLVKRYLL